MLKNYPLDYLKSQINIHHCFRRKVAMNLPQAPLSKPPRAAATHAPVREALRRKRRQTGICLLLALIVVGIYPSLRDRLNARDYVQRVAPGQILISTPKLIGGMFRDSELLILRHDDQGTWALVLGVPFPEGLERMRQLQDTQRESLLDAAQPNDLWGGPLNLDKPLKLSTNQPSSNQPSSNQLGVESIAIGEYNHQVHLTSTLDTAVEATRAMTFRGYAGWHPGQLARELRAGRWQVPAASAPIVERHLAELFNAITSQDKAYGH